MVIVIFQSGIVEVTPREALRRMEEAVPRTARGGAALSALSGIPFAEASALYTCLSDKDFAYHRFTVAMIC